MTHRADAQVKVTRILERIQEGHCSAAAELLPLVYDELRVLAERFLRRERPDHTLQPTALVHEAYARLVNANSIQWHGRAHFYAVAANAMRRILINYAERRRSVKRGGNWHRVTLDESNTSAPQSKLNRHVDLIALDEALNALEKLDERQCRVIELRFFSGLSVDEAAKVLGVSPRSVQLDWKMARAWLYKRLQQ